MRCRNSGGPSTTSLTSPVGTELKEPLPVVRGDGAVLRFAEDPTQTPAIGSR